jgi:hypothetical protein
MSRITIIGDKEVTNPAAKAAISIVAVPLTLMFVFAVLAGTFAFIGIVFALSLGFIGALFIVLAILIPVIIVLAVIAKIVSWPFTHFGPRDDD